MKISGIYEIYNELTGDCYIGSSINIENRWKRHRKDLKKGNHHSIILQRAYNKYGEKAFIYKILVYCQPEELIDKENYFIIAAEPKYNICRIAGSCLGIKQSEETKAKKRKSALERGIKPPLIEKSVVQLDYFTGKDIAEFDSITKALASLGKNADSCTTVAKVCEGKRNSAYGYKWRWKDKPQVLFKTKKRTLIEIENGYQWKLSS